MEFPVLKYTVQLYYSPEQAKQFFEDIEPPVQIASGVLIIQSRRHYLVTCKHVFDGIDPYDVIIITTFGFAVRLLPEKVKLLSGNHDSIDLAAIQFDNNQVAALRTVYSFLPEKNLGLDHVFDEDLYYMMFGFVNAKTELEDYAFYPMPFGFLTGIIYRKNIHKLGLNYENNITLEYNRRKQTYLFDEYDGGGRLGYKDLTGLSGGGVWLSVEGQKPETYDYILVGIMTEQHISKGFVAGTKIALLDKMI